MGFRVRVNVPAARNDSVTILMWRGKGMRSTEYTPILLKTSY